MTNLTPPDGLGRAIGALALVHLALGLVMVAAPGFFFEEVAPYGERNDHYLRDVSTFYLAFAAVLWIAAARTAWRVPVLAFAAIQYVLHAVNHLVDVGETDPAALGVTNFVSIAAGAVAFLLLARAAAMRHARERTR